GLSLVKAIVDAHGGRVQISSELNHGTTVSVWLPLHQAKNQIELRIAGQAH
ncbi:MAG: hypothetical protein CVV27_03330, partial [Candidatus Melainabacteria bacterium HGW-Melainabacteria-1]